MRARLVTIAALVALASPAVGAGYYNMPTSWQQCLGVGFGPGYHAPLLLGPMMESGIAAQRVQRVPAPYPPPACGGFDAPSVWCDSPMAYGDMVAAPTQPYLPMPSSLGGYATAAPSVEYSARPAAVLQGPMLSGGAEEVPVPPPVGR